MHEVIIIGAGPAGLTAGLYTGRYGLKTLILEKMAPGGQILFSPAIENFPGFPGGIAPEDLISRLKKQVEDVGVKIELEEVKEILLPDEAKPLFYHVKTTENIYETKTIIIATGAEAKRLGVGGEEKFLGRGVSYCGVCDAPLFKDKEIVVIGAGNRAVEEAIFLSGYARKVTLIHRRMSLRAAKILEEKAGKNPRINFLLDTVVEEIYGKTQVEGLKIKNVKTGATSEVNCQGVFIFVGITPNTAFLRKQLQMDALGFIITDEELRTSKDGIFACGDCRRKSLYQVINACGEGAVAADACQKYLS